MQDITWLDRSIQATRIAVEAQAESNQQAELSYKFATRLRARFEQRDNITDLNDAIVAYQRALELMPDGHNAQARLLNDLATSLLVRYRSLGQLIDLEGATVAYRREVEVMPDNHPVKPLALSNYGASLLEHFTRTGEPGDLESAISSYHRALELTPDWHPNKPSSLSSLGNALRTRYERTEQLDDLERAIAVQRRAIQLTPHDHPDQSDWLNNFGLSLLVHFEHTGELESLEQAVSAHRSATELTPPDHPDQRVRYSNLGLSLLRHFERTGEIEDLKQAILAHRHAVELAPDEHPDKPLHCNNLGISFMRLFERTGELDDIDQAISMLRSGVERIPNGHVEKPSMVHNLGTSLLLRYESAGDVVDHDEAIAAQQRAIQLAPEGQPNMTMLYNSLSCCLVHRYLRTRDLQDLRTAISTFHKTTEMSPEGDPFLSTCFTNLGAAHRLLFENTRTQADFDAAIQSFMTSATQSSGLPSERMKSAMRCTSMLSTYPAFSSTTQLVSAHSRVIAVLPEVVWLGHGVKRRFDESAKYGEVVSAAVATAIGAGALTQAVEWLEAGRSLIWSQVLSLRTPLDELRESHADLASALHAVQVQLQQSVHSSLLPDSMNSLTTANGIPEIATNPIADRHRSLVVEYEKLLKRIRSCPGFEDFLRPKELAALVPSSQLLDGYVVFLNVHASRCDALILSSTGDITLVPLDQLSLQRATELRRVWIKCIESEGVRSRASAKKGDFAGGLKPLKNCLKQMWSLIVEPVLHALNFKSRPVENERLPHIIWCPTGPLMQLPLHAAGLYNDTDDPRIYNLVVSSYTPSLSALKRSYDGLREPTPPRETLIVTQPATPYHAPLPGTMYEGVLLQEMLRASGYASKLLNDTEATVSSVGAVLNQYPWVHLACHGSQHPDDATRSAFELFDGPLTLANLMGTAADDAELAFLSACQTAVGDEKVPEESAHLAAGMLAVGFKGVVATMWSIQDADAPIVVEAFYRSLLASRSAGRKGVKGTGAAYALHEATRVLRDKVGEDSFMRWVPFVHFGV
ncbi:TPR-like protein [Peniophora sp. CONT]|nr:TPR-like protein [Peniophora sp. CONT]